MLKEIPNHPGYFVDETGEAVYSNKRKKVKLLKTFLWDDYRTVALYCNGRETKRKIAYLVLTTFVSPRPYGNEIRHGIKGRHHDSLDNLKWGSPEENIQDMITQNEILKGEQVGTSKLDSMQVRIIRAAKRLNGKTPINQFDNAGYLSARYLAKVFQVSKSIIQRIWNNKMWKHI